MISSQRSGPSARSLFARTRTGTDGFALTGVAIRILIVDDIEAWHCIYTEVLCRNQDWQIVGIARNGVEAIKKSRELKPDVVLLDVALGRADRLEAARQISEVSPDSRLLLLGTTESSQLAELALSIGAYGYVSKRNVVLDLVPAIQALAKGKRFRS
jgi:DNA-binding NarL/FixJ family response regulator